MCTLRYKVGSPLKAELEKHKPQCMEFLASALEKAVTSPKRKKSAVKRKHLRPRKSSSVTFVSYSQLHIASLVNFVLALNCCCYRVDKNTRYYNNPRKNESVI